MKFKQLEITYPLPQILQDTIDEFVDYLNSTDDPLHADLYESEIRALLNGCDADLNKDQYWELCYYYVFKGIFERANKEDNKGD